MENVLKFNNSLTTMTLSAADLREVLEHGFAATEEGNTPGQFPQIAGLAVSFDPTLDPGSRVVSLAVLDDSDFIADVIVEDGALVGDPEREIRIVTLNFLAGGGDDYPFPDLGDAILETETGEQAALADYLTAFHPEPASAFDVVDTDAEFDQHIQNLSLRPDTVLVNNTWVYEFTRTSTGTPFFTLSGDEADALMEDADFSFTGTPWSVPSPGAGTLGTASVYRFLNSSTLAHFYTASEAERDAIIDSNPFLLFEGEVFTAFPTPQDTTIPLYRFYDTASGTHVYTADATEQAELAADPDYADEGVAFHVYP
jgi:hypothetical protein